MSKRPYSERERDRWVAEAAYYRAEKRGFMPGFALEDWLAAEVLIAFEIARALTQSIPESPSASIACDNAAQDAAKNQEKIAGHFRTRTD
jgi:Protein of unknown function (DUF2934)